MTNKKIYSKIHLLNIVNVGKSKRKRAKNITVCRGGLALSTSIGGGASLLLIKRSTT